MLAVSKSNCVTDDFFFFKKDSSTLLWYRCVNKQLLMILKSASAASLFGLWSSATSRCSCSVIWAHGTDRRNRYSQFFFPPHWARIWNRMSSQAQAWSQAPSYSLSTKWHALLWTRASVSVSGGDTLPGMRAAFFKLLHIIRHINRRFCRGGHPVSSMGYKRSSVFSMM